MTTYLSIKRIDNIGNNNPGGYRQYVALKYGEHSLEKDSFAKYVDSKLLSLCKSPYKINEDRIIIISEYSDNSEYVVWDETTNYTICDAVGIKTMYPIEYAIYTECSENFLEDWLKIFSLSLFVDGVKVDIGPLKEGIYSRDNEVSKELFEYWVKDGYIFVRFVKLISLNSSKLEIKIKEYSLNKKNDNKCSIDVRTPTFGSKLNLHLPEGYRTQYPSYLSPAYLSSYSNFFEFIKDSTTITRGNHIEIKYDGWILPGAFIGIEWDCPSGG